MNATEIKNYIISIEKKFLSYIYYNQEDIYRLMDMIKVEYFFNIECGLLYKCFLELSLQNIKFEETIIKHNIIKSNSNIISVFEEIIKLNFKSDNIDEIAIFIKNEYNKRQIIKFSSNIISTYKNNPFDYEKIKNIFETDYYNVLDKTTDVKLKPFNNSVNEIIEELKNIMNNNDFLTGIPTGFKELDYITSGWQKSDYIIIASRPSIGKTAIGIKFALEAIKNNKKALFFSIEMAQEPVVKRFISMDLEIEPTLIKYPDENIIKKINNIKSREYYNNLFIIDEPFVTTGFINKTLYKYNKIYGIDLVILDYLQYIKPEKGKKNTTRENDISEISSSLKSIARQFDIPFIVLSQLNRSVELRQNKKPMLADLRESGSIEQDADIVIFLYRPFKYKILNYDDENKTKTNFYFNDSIYEISEFLIEKNRNGKTQEIKFINNNSMSFFDNFDINYLPYLNDNSNLTSFNEVDKEDDEEIPF